MSVAGIAALHQDRDAALGRGRIRRVPDRELIVIARSPGKDDGGRRLRRQRVIDGGSQHFLEAARQLSKVLDPKGMKTGAFLDDNALRQRPSRREQFAFRGYLPDIIPAESGVKIRRNALKRSHDNSLLPVRPDRTRTPA